MAAYAPKIIRNEVGKVNGIPNMYSNARYRVDSVGLVSRKVEREARKSGLRRKLTKRTIKEALIYISQSRVVVGVTSKRRKRKKSFKEEFDYYWEISSGL